MNSIQTRKTATEILSTPSTFGMPFGVSACGHAPDVARIKGDMGLADVRTYAPGSRAWSPPS